MAMAVNDIMIPVRMLTQYVYCNRLGYMEWLQGEFETSTDVEQGRFVHRNVDTISGTKKIQQDGEIHATSVMISDVKLGLVGKLDLLEIEGRAAVPVEYKKGKVPDIQGNVYDSTLVQVCAQALLLRANGYKCTEGVVYYVASRRRVRVIIDDILIAKTLQAIWDLKEMVKKNIIPPPLVDSPKCPRCSLVGICLPDEVNLLSNQKIKVDSVRRMYPIRADAVPVHIQEQGASVSVTGDTLQVKSTDGQKRKIRIIDVLDLTVYGNVQITTQALRRLLERGISVCYMTYGGWFVGMTNAGMNRNIDLRIHQHRVYDDKISSLDICKNIVYGKIRNCMTLLRRNHKSDATRVLGEMSQMADKSRGCKKYETLLGIEGMAARLYFSNFAGMLKDDSGFDFKQRNRRPPKDPVNAILSFLYALLARQATVTVMGVGLDPYIGYLHTPHHGRPSLALDMMEEFRPIICDSVCISMINNSMLVPSDFTDAAMGVSMTQNGRRRVLDAFETRMDTTIKHEILGYSASYRRILETQVRLLARRVTGEIQAYPPFRVR